MVSQINVSPRPAEASTQSGSLLNRAQRSYAQQASRVPESSLSSAADNKGCFTTLIDTVKEWLSFIWDWLTSWCKTPNSPSAQVKIEATPIAGPIVSEVQKSEWSTIVKVLGQWEKSLQEKGENWGRIAPGNQTAHRVLPAGEICAQMIHQIKTPAHERVGGDPWNVVLICKDANHKIQAIALHDKQSNRLADLATHPDNIDHPINDAVPRVKGAGTQIILHLAKETVRADSTLRLRSVRDAVPFYKKMHFEDDPAFAGVQDGALGITSMKLTAERIRSLVRNQTPPFNQLRLN